jgi:hypothetical protein
MRYAVKFTVRKMNMEEKISVGLLAVWGTVQLVEINTVLETIVLVISIGIGVRGLIKGNKKKDA